MLLKVIDSPDLIEMGKRIRSERIAKGLSQKELASAAGLSYNTVSRAEGAQAICSIESLFAIADTLSVTPNDLSPSRFRCSSCESPLSELSEKFARLTPANQQIVLKSMAAMLDGLIKQQNNEM